MSHLRLDFPDTRPARRTLPGALREPLRRSMLVGLSAMIVGAFLPWIHGFRPGTGWFDISGFEQSGDGGIVLELALLAGVLVVSDRAWGSRMAFVVALPALLGLGSLGVMRLAYDTSSTYLRLLANAGGEGTFQFGFWLVVAGATVTTVGGAVALWRARGRVSLSTRGMGWVLAGAVGGVTGGVGGFVVGTQIAGLLTRNATVGASSVLIALAFVLAFLGTYLGAVIAVRLTRGPRRP